MQVAARTAIAGCGIEGYNIYEPFPIFSELSPKSLVIRLQATLRGSTMQAMATAMAGTGIEVAGAGANGTSHGKRGVEGANGESPDFGIALIAKMQSLSIALESVAHSSSRKTVSGSGTSAKEGEQSHEPLAEKSSREKWEDAATAPVEVVKATILGGSSPPEGVDPPKQAIGGPVFHLAATSILTERVPSADAGKGGPSRGLQGVSPVGISSHEPTNEESAKTGAANGETTGKLGAQTVASLTGGASPVDAAACISSLMIQEDGTHSSADNGVKELLPQSSFLQRPASQYAVEPESESAEASAFRKARMSDSTTQDGKIPNSSLPGVAENSAVGVVASLSLNPSATVASVFAATTGKSAVKSTPNGAIGANSTPAAGRVLAAPGSNGPVGEAASVGTPAGLAADPGVGASAIPAGESFRQIDTAAESPRVLRTTANVVEVGVNDPAHGWVEVRAENAAGQIHASLSASSLEAQSALHARLPEMVGYLADRDIGVRSLAVDHVAKESASFGDTNGGGSRGHGREFSGGADSSANGDRAAEASQSSGPAEADGVNGSRLSGTSPENGIAMQLADGRGAAIVYPPHTINVLA